MIELIMKLKVGESLKIDRETKNSVVVTVRYGVYTESVEVKNLHMMAEPDVVLVRETDTALRRLRKHLCG